MTFDGQVLFLAHSATEGRQRALLFSHSRSQANGADTLSEVASHSDRGMRTLEGLSLQISVASKPNSSSQLETCLSQSEGEGNKIL